MICRQDNLAMTAKSAAATRTKGELLTVAPIAVTIVGACIVASEAIKANLTAAGSMVVLLLGIAIWLCVIEYAAEEFIRRPRAARLQENTSVYARQIHGFTNEQLIELFIIHSCPQVRNIYLRDDNAVCLKGRYTTHFIEFGSDGAAVYSEKHTYKAQREACEIIRFMAGACR